MAANSLYFLLCILMVPHFVQSWLDTIRYQSSRVGKVSKCEFPSAVFITFTDMHHNHKECGGVILDNKRVATAAHCVIPELRKVNIKTGITESNKHGVQLPWRRVISKVTNKKGQYKNGLAIITLSRAIQFFSCYKSIELAKPDETFFDRTCMSIGWVLDKTTNKKLLTKTQQSIVSSSECSGHGKHAEQGQLCAGGMNMGLEDTCLGDSGVPLICIRQNGDQVLTGFAVKGDVCSNKHSIFTDVASHNEWLSAKH